MYSILCTVLLISPVAAFLCDLKKKNNCGRDGFNINTLCFSLPELSSCKYLRYRTGTLLNPVCPERIVNKQFKVLKGVLNI
jgi:hypothetical protein